MLNLNTLKQKIEKVNPEFERKAFGMPILIGWPGVRKKDCKFFKLHPRYRTEYCIRPEHVEMYLQDGRGKIYGCETCPLFDDGN